MLFMVFGQDDNRQFEVSGEGGAVQICMIVLISAALGVRCIPTLSQTSRCEWLLLALMARALP